MSVHEVFPAAIERGLPLVPPSVPHFREWRARARSFTDMAIIGAWEVEVGGDGEPQRIPTARVSPSVFAVLGVQPRLGRAFREDEEARRAADRS